MNRKILALLLVLVLVFAAAAPAMAAGGDKGNIGISITKEKPLIFQDTITVTENGGKFHIGIVTISFPENFIDESKLPMTFNVKITAVNGVAGVEITPETGNFNGDVIIKVNPYKGFLYDEATGENIKVDIDKLEIIVNHFSRYAFS